jgi:hypothetical protein
MTTLRQFADSVDESHSSHYYGPNPTHRIAESVERYEATASDAQAAAITDADRVAKMLKAPKALSEIAAALSTVEAGQVAIKIRFDHKFWNVYKLAAKERNNYNSNYQYNNDGSFSYNYNMPQEIADAIDKKISDQNLRERSYSTHYIAVPELKNNGRFIYQIIQFTIPYSGYPSYYNASSYSSNFNIRNIGSFEIVHTNDESVRYNPFRVHGYGEGIRGTAMEHRVHEMVKEHKQSARKAPPHESPSDLALEIAHLPLAVQEKIKAEIDAYNEQRAQNRLDPHKLQNDDGTALQALKNRERKLDRDFDSQNKDHQEAAMKRHATLAAEFKDRQMVARMKRAKAHGDEFLDTPEQFARMRVHELTHANRVHTDAFNPRKYSKREEQFFRENHEGGYLETVENAIAAHNAEQPIRVHTGTGQRINSTELTHERTHSDGSRIHADRIHYDAKRIHKERTHYKGDYQISRGVGKPNSNGLAAPNASDMPVLNLEEAKEDFEGLSKQEQLKKKAISAERLNTDAKHEK